MPNPAVILTLPMRSNDAGAATVRDYLVALLSQLWEATEGFSGKHPFGNSGWEYDLYVALTDAGLVEGDEDGYPLNENDAHALIQTAITALAAPAIIAATIPTVADLSAATHPLHDFTTDGWRYWCHVCNPLDADEPDPVFEANDSAAA